MVVFKQIRAKPDGRMGEPMIIGSMGLKPDGKLWVKGAPDIVRLAQNPLILTFGDTVDPATEPQRFLDALPNRFHGTYFWAEAAPDASPVPLSIPIAI
jgi:hypothetical protein